MSLYCNYYLIFRECDHLENYVAKDLIRVVKAKYSNDSSKKDKSLDDEV